MLELSIETYFDSSSIPITTISSTNCFEKSDVDKGAIYTDELLWLNLEVLSFLYPFSYLSISIFDRFFDLSDAIRLRFLS
jgi:hypothetical protein